MKVFIFFYLFFNFCFVCISQNNKIVFKQNNSIYYQKVNEGETLLINKDYLNAYILYQNLKVDTVNYFYAKELYNYSVCCLIVNKLVEAKDGFVELMKRGFQYEWLLENGVEISKLGSELLKQIKNSKFQGNRFNLTVRNELEKIAVIDQKERKGKDMYNRNLAKIVKSDSMNYIMLARILKKYKRLPDEQLIGVTNKDLYYHNYYLHIWHCNQMITSYSYINIVKQALNNNQIEPYYGVLLYNNITKYDTLAPLLTLTKLIYPTEKYDLETILNLEIRDSVAKDFGWYKPKFNSVNLAFVNGKRLKYNLPTLEATYNNFKKTNGNAYPFIISSLKGSQQIFQCNTKQDCDGFLNWYEPL